MWKNRDREVMDGPGLGTDSRAQRRLRGAGILLRLGILHPSFAGTGGAEVLAAAQAGDLAARGHAVCLATMAWNGDRWAGPLSGVEIRLVPKRRVEDALSFGRLGKIRSRGRRLMGQLADREVILAHTFPAEL